ncbi:hypothetical protein [Mesorhizobium marinum]|uniref:Uncharacterized protein n=1 Tax=Mesorhizobium marinum TaxID=3228790 RepID=A0ABV3R123_9HYPH
MSKLNLRKELDAFKKQYGDVPASQEMASVILWQVNADGRLTRVSEASEIPGLDIVAIPAGKFLREDFSNFQQLPEVERIRSYSHLPDLPPRMPAVPPLVDVPENPLPAPTPIGEPVEPSASPDPLRPRGTIEIDEEAVLVSIAEHRAKRETATEIVHRIHNERMATSKARQQGKPKVKEQPAPQELTHLVAMAPQWRPHS